LGNYIFNRLQKSLQKHRVSRAQLPTKGAQYSIRAYRRTDDFIPGRGHQRLFIIIRGKFFLPPTRQIFPSGHVELDEGRKTKRGN
jgi:hypothetical protein